MTEKLSHEKLTAYIRGELSDEERRSIERILDEEPAARTTLAELRVELSSDPEAGRYSKLSADSWNPPPAASQRAALEEANIIFACPNCRAKYSISREKVRGKAFRVICKKCGESIIIKGDAPGPQIRASSPFPITPSQAPPPAENAPIPLVSRDKNESARGVFGDEGGMPDSGPGLFDDRSESAPSAPGLFDARASEEEPSSWDSEGSEKTPTRDVESEESSNDTVVTTNPFYEPPPPAPEPEPTGPRVSAASMLTAARNENSVLFSLSSLKSLAAEAQGVSRIAAEPRPAQPQNLGGRTTANRESETSGLIDIRALSGALRAERAAADNSDDFIALSAPAPTAPVLTAKLPSGSGLAAKVVVLSAVLGVLVSGVVLAVIITMSKETKKSDQAYLALQAKIEELQKAAANAQSPRPSAVAVAPVAPAPVAPAPAAPAPAVAAPEPAPVPSAAAQAPAPPAAEATGSKGTAAPQKKLPAAGPAPGALAGKGSPVPKPAEAPKEAAPATAAEPAPEPPQPALPPEAKPAAPAAAPAPPAPPAKKASDDLDNLLNPGVAPKKPPEPAAAPAPAPSADAEGGAPAKLSREEVIAGMNAIAPRIKACGQGQTGTITLKMVVAKTGRVQSAAPLGAFAGTPVGECAAREARTASFPVSQSDLTVKYPFAL